VKLPYVVVDVFTETPLQGNSLAVFLDGPSLETETMQRIAREMNLSESVFLEPATLEGCVRSLRIFTPGREMRFAGHPTIGTSFVLADQAIASGAFQVQEKVGPVAVRVEPGDRPLVWLSTPPIEFQETFDRAACAGIIGLQTDDLLDVSPQILSAGNPILLVGLKTAELVDQAAFNFAAHRALTSHFPEPICFFIFAQVPTGAYSRMFAPDLGLVEDPATGSATGPLGAYMLKHKLLPGDGLGRFVSEQGKKMGRRSLLHFEVSPDGIDVGGYVTPIIEGVLTL
jgi:trans-2,3-dihydro-3-hydroxyanthranilate isomerase